MQNSFFIAGPKPDYVSEMTHEEAKRWLPKITEMCSNGKIFDFYRSVEPQVYDEVMRLGNFNEPYVIVD